MQARVATKPLGGSLVLSKPLKHVNRPMCPRAGPIHHDNWQHHTQPGSSSLEDTMTTEFHAPKATAPATYPIASLNPALFSPDIAQAEAPSMAHAVPAADSCPAGQEKGAVPAAPAEWRHPYPSNPKRWKVDEDMLYIPPPGWPDNM